MRQLTSPRENSTGHTEVCRNGKWHSICSGNEDGNEDDGRVVCRYDSEGNYRISLYTLYIHLES